MMSAADYVPGGCVIHLAATNTWQRYSPEGDHVMGGAMSSFPTAEHWIVQGRNLAGSTYDAPFYADYVVAAMASESVILQIDAAALTLRCSNLPMDAHNHLIPDGPFFAINGKAEAEVVVERFMCQAASWRFKTCTFRQTLR